MYYDRKKVAIVMVLKGRDGISFYEYRILATGETKILRTKNFYRRYGVEK